MKETSLTASVNYGDYGGTVEADRHDHRDLIDLAKRYGVDTDRFFVFGLDMDIGETRGDSLGHVGVVILLWTLKPLALHLLSTRFNSTSIRIEGRSRTYDSISTRG